MSTREPKSSWRGAQASVLAGQALAAFDMFAMTAAAPAIERALGDTGVHLVLATYLIAFGAGVVSGGRLGDRYGPRRCFLAGVAAFVLAALVSWLAPSPGVLVAGRAIQGASAAVFVPQVLVVLRTMAPSPVARTRALAAYGVTIGVASLVAWLGGGVLLTLDPLGLGWRAILLASAVAGVGVWVAGQRLLPADTAAPIAGRLDWPGALMIAAALVALLMPLIALRQSAWSLRDTLSVLAALCALSALRSWEARFAARGGFAVLPPALLRSRSFRRAAAALMLFHGPNAALYLLFSLHLQSGLGLPTAAAGLAVAPATAASTAASMVLRSSDRPSSHLLMTGLSLTAVGLLGAMAATRSPIAVQPFALAAALAVCTSGHGLVAPLLTDAAIAHAPPRLAGAWSGALLTTTWLAFALGIAGAATAFPWLLATLGAASSEAGSAGALAVALVPLLVAVGVCARLMQPA